MLKSQRGFSSLVIIVLILIGLFAATLLLKNNSFSNLLEPKSPSNTLNRVYMVYKNPQQFIDAGSKEEGQVNLPIELPDYTGAIDNPDGIQLSKDKSFVVFIKNGDFWKVDLDGKSSKQLTQNLTKVSAGQCPIRIAKFMLSPDNRKIYYQLLDDSFTKTGGYPAVSRDYEGKPCSPVLEPYKPQEWILSIAGDKKQIKRILGGRSLAWSFDSQAILYTDHEPNAKLISFDIATNKQSTLLDEEVFSIFWSQDGKKVVYTSSPNNAARFNNEGDDIGMMYVAESGDLKKRISHILEEGRPKENALLNSDYSYAWWKQVGISPDGRYVVLVKTPQVNKKNQINDAENSYFAEYSEVYLWDTQTNTDQKLPITVNQKAPIKWSADGDFLIYHIRRQAIKPNQIE
jgi:Tol biopolymer transport system component